MHVSIRALCLMYPLNRYRAVHRIRLVCLNPKTADYLIFKWMTEINEALMFFPHQQSQFYLAEPCFRGEFPIHRHIHKRKKKEITYQIFSAEKLRATTVLEVRTRIPGKIPPGMHRNLYQRERGFKIRKFYRKFKFI